ncbi:uncharacterized protein LOC131218778 isoform X2 [Magnolia sinica]|uniref:uncharacterized protein LOC131218778 isoform X2 n=1 Tax=Magnolia sinica TaxID=86752 RepID=UPI0026583EEB|nr:uncharacterized protein LOC131218778 isoform X2 [Magnolia sinica]
MTIMAPSLALHSLLLLEEYLKKADQLWKLSTFKPRIRVLILLILFFLLLQSKKGTASTTTETKSNERYRPPKVVNEVKMKVQRLKDTRDYSFLLSDDAELPAPSKEPASRNVSVLSSDARSAQVPSKNRPSSMNKPSSMSKPSPMSKPSSTSKPARPLSSGHEERKSVANGREDRKSVSSGREDRKFVSGREDRNSVSMNRQVQTKVAHPKAASVSRPEQSSADPRKLLGSNHGNGPGRPTGSKGPLPKAPATALDKKKTSAVGTNSSVPGKQKTPQFKSHSSSQNQYAEQKRVPQRPEKSKMMSKQPVSSSKPQVKPPKQIPSRAIQEARPKKRPVHNYSDDDDEDAAAINMIRSMFRYNPNKYVDDDVSDMEANFDDILKEERRSAKIAREEDEREARLIEEEERRERLKKEAKRRKLSQR